MAKEKFSSQMGVIAAAAGSAVGLGNVWRFPYIVGEDGGAVFLLLYVIFTFTIAIPVLMTEFAIGRMSGLPVTSAFRALHPGGKWQIIGFMGMITAFMIVSYYCIVSGWTFFYSISAINGTLTTLTEASTKDYFTSLATDPVQCILWLVVALGATSVIVARGVTKGIEKYSKILMPILFVLIIIMLVRALTLDGGAEGLKFFLMPDTTKFTAKTFFDALGQSFFSISIGMGTMTTYGSYLKKDQSIPDIAVRVASIDFLVAFLSGAIIFPCVFAFGINPGEGPGLVFVTLPNVFNQMILGQVFSSIFFVLLFVAALTSSISLLEVVVAYFETSYKMPRVKATIISAGLALICGVACSVSGTVFDIFDKVSANILMPLGALFIVIFATHKISYEQFRAEVEAHGKHFALFKVCFILLKYILPIFFALIFINGLVAWLA